VCGCQAGATAKIAFTVRGAQRATVELIGPEGRVVRTLARDQRLPGGRRTLTWDGRDQAGRIVADGPYRVRVRLLDLGRDLTLTTAIVVDTAPPRARLLSIAPRAVVAGREARPALVRYVAGEAGRPALVIDGRTATRAGERPAGEATVAWRGRARGRTLSPGAYRVAVRIRDRAGNLGEPSRSLPVRILKPRRRR
jgi:hypothetical protein